MAAAGGAGRGMLLRGRVAGAILHQPLCRVFKEGSEGGAPKRQACVLKLVCGCNNFVFIGARRLYSLAWVLPVLWVRPPPTLERAKKRKGAYIYYCILIMSDNMLI